jgi:hypothetical protein
MNLRYEILKKRRSKIHLHDLVLILKCLYPHKAVNNPFEEQIYYQKDWTEIQKELVVQLTVSSTLINQKYRCWDKWLRLEAIEEDYVNALALAQRELSPKKPTVLLESSTRRMLIEIMSEHGANPFTNRQVRRSTYMSKSHVHRCLQELISTGLAEISGGYPNRGFYYQLTEKAFK